MSSADEILKLKKLLDEGIITEQEFKIKKNVLLNEEIEQRRQKEDKTVNNQDKEETTEHPTTNKVKNIGFSITCGYIIGSLFILSGLGTMIMSNVISGFFMILAGLIVIPAINNFFEKKLNFKLSKPLRIVICIVLLCIYTATLNPGSDMINTNVSTNTNISKIDKNKNEDKNKRISKDDIIKGKDMNITLKDVKISQKVDPPNKSGYYNYYQVDDTDNTYLYVILNCKNTSTIDILASEVATVTVKCDNKYTYSSFDAVTDNTSGFTYSNITNIKQLTNQKIYYLAEIPKSLVNNKSIPIEVNIEFENKTYTYQYR